MAGLSTGAGAPVVKVYHEKSMILPDVSRVLACLYEKDVKFETVKDSYKDLLRLQATRSVPVPFYDGPTFLQESRAICRYIAETYERCGYPFLLGKDVLERASIEQWLRHEEHAFDPPSRALFCHLAFPLHDEGIDDIDREKRRLEEVLEVYEQRLGESEFLAGNKFTLADLVHLPNTHHIVTSEKFVYLYDSRKNVQRWWNTISARDSWQKVVRDMKSVEEQHQREEFEQPQWEEFEPLPKSDGRSIRIDPRQQARTDSRTILVPPPSGGVISSSFFTVPQEEQPLPAETISHGEPPAIERKESNFFAADVDRRAQQSTPKKISTEQSYKSAMYERAPAVAPRQAPPSGTRRTSASTPLSQESVSSSQQTIESIKGISPTLHDITGDESDDIAMADENATPPAPPAASDGRSVTTAFQGDVLDARGENEAVKPSVADPRDMPTTPKRPAATPDNQHHTTSDRGATEPRKSPSINEQQPAPPVPSQPPITSACRASASSDGAAQDDDLAHLSTIDQSRHASTPPQTQQGAPGGPSIDKLDKTADVDRRAQQSTSKKISTEQSDKNAMYERAPAVAPRQAPPSNTRRTSVSITPSQESVSSSQQTTESIKGVTPTLHGIAGDESDNITMADENATPPAPPASDGRSVTTTLQGGVLDAHGENESVKPSVADPRGMPTTPKRPAATPDNQCHITSDRGATDPRKSPSINEQQPAPPVPSQPPTTGAWHASASSNGAAQDDDLAHLSTIDEWRRTSTPLQTQQGAPGSPSIDKLDKTTYVDRRAQQSTQKKTSTEQSDKSALYERAPAVAPRQAPPSDTHRTLASIPPSEESFSSSQQTTESIKGVTPTLHGITGDESDNIAMADENATPPAPPASDGRSVTTAFQGDVLDARGENEAVKPSVADARDMPTTPKRQAATPDNQRHTTSDRGATEPRKSPSINEQQPAPPVQSQQPTTGAWLASASSNGGAQDDDLAHLSTIGEWQHTSTPPQTQQGAPGGPSIDKLDKTTYVDRRAQQSTPKKTSSDQSDKGAMYERAPAVAPRQAPPSDTRRTSASIPPSQESVSSSQQTTESIKGVTPTLHGITGDESDNISMADENATPPAPPASDGRSVTTDFQGGVLDARRENEAVKPSVVDPRGMPTTPKRPTATLDNQRHTTSDRGGTDPRKSPSINEQQPAPPVPSQPPTTGAWHASASSNGAAQDDDLAHLSTIDEWRRASTPLQTQQGAPGDPSIDKLDKRTYVDRRAQQSTPKKISTEQSDKSAMYERAPAVAPRQAPPSDTHRTSASIPPSQVSVSSSQQTTESIKGITPTLDGIAGDESDNIAMADENATPPAPPASDGRSVTTAFQGGVLDARGENEAVKPSVPDPKGMPTTPKRPAATPDKQRHTTSDRGATEPRKSPSINEQQPAPPVQSQQPTTGAWHASASSNGGAQDDDLAHLSTIGEWRHTSTPPQTQQGAPGGPSIDKLDKTTYVDRRAQQSTPKKTSSDQSDKSAMYERAPAVAPRQAPPSDTRRTSASIPPSEESVSSSQQTTESIKGVTPTSHGITGDESDNISMANENATPPAPPASDGRSVTTDFQGGILDARGENEAVKPSVVDPRGMPTTPKRPAATPDNQRHTTSDRGATDPRKSPSINEQQPAPPVPSQPPTTGAWHASASSNGAAQDDDLARLSTIDEWRRASTPLQTQQGAPGDPSIDKLDKRTYVDRRAQQSTPKKTSTEQSNKSAMYERAPAVAPRQAPNSNTHRTSASIPPSQESVSSSQQTTESIKGITPTLDGIAGDESDNIAMADENATPPAPPASDGRSVTTAFQGGVLDARGENEAVKPSVADPRGMPATPKRPAATPDNQRHTTLDRGATDPRKSPSINEQQPAPPVPSQPPTTGAWHASASSNGAAQDDDLAHLSTIDEWRHASTPPQTQQGAPSGPSIDKLDKTTDVDRRAQQSTPKKTSTEQLDKSDMYESAPAVAPRQAPPSDTRRTSASIPPSQESVSSSQQTTESFKGVTPTLHGTPGDESNNIAMADENATPPAPPASDGRSVTTALQGGVLDARGENEAVKPSAADPRGMRTTPKRPAATPDNQRHTTSDQVSDQAPPLSSFADTRNARAGIAEADETIMMAPDEQHVGRPPKNAGAPAAGPLPMRSQKNMNEAYSDGASIQQLSSVQSRAQPAENKKKQGGDATLVTEFDKSKEKGFLANANQNNTEQAKATSAAGPSKKQIHSDQNHLISSKDIVQDIGKQTNETVYYRSSSTSREMLPSAPKKSMREQQLQGDKSSISPQDNGQQGSEAVLPVSGTEQPKERELLTNADRNSGKTPGQALQESEEQTFPDTQQVKNNGSNIKSDGSRKPTQFDGNEDDVPESQRGGSSTNP